MEAVIVNSQVKPQLFFGPNTNSVQVLIKVSSNSDKKFPEGNLEVILSWCKFSKSIEI